MFPAELRGQDVKLTVNLIVNLSPLTSHQWLVRDNYGDSRPVIRSQSQITSFLASTSHHCSTHARAQFRKTNETEKPQTFPISLAVSGLEVKY